MSYGDGRRFNLNEEDFKVEPVFNGWQLIGDSQFLRFSEQLLDKSRKRENKIAYLGLCVSGQKTADLLERVEGQFRPISDKVILMIGTNDLLQDTNSNVLRATLQKLILHLCTQTLVRSLIILTIPPVPRLKNSPAHWKTLKEYNEHIKTFSDKGVGNRIRICVIDAYARFIKNNELSRSSLSISRNSLSSLRSSPSSLRNSPTPSRSSLVSYSSGISSPLLRNSNNSLNIPPYTSNFGKIRTNLRIQVGDVPNDREIYVLDTDSDDDEDEQDGGYESVKSTPASKRSSFMSRFPSPNPKRRSLGSGSYNVAQDDHNDSFYEDMNSEPVDQSEEINLDYFEKYFDVEEKRQDLIHLNNKGLRLIKKLICDVIDA